MLPAGGKGADDPEAMEVDEPPVEKRKITEQSPAGSNLEPSYFGASDSSEPKKMKMESRSSSKSGRHVSFMADEKDKPVFGNPSCSSVKEHLYKGDDHLPPKQPSTSTDRSSLRSNWHERRKREERSPVHSKKRTSNQ